MEACLKRGTPIWSPAVLQKHAVCRPSTPRIIGPRRRFGESSNEALAKGGSAGLVLLASMLMVVGIGIIASANNLMLVWAT